MPPRPYGFNDTFKGALTDAATVYQGIPVSEWLSRRGLCADDVEGHGDMQSAVCFPSVRMWKSWAR